MPLNIVRKRLPEVQRFQPKRRLHRFTNRLRPQRFSYSPYNEGEGKRTLRTPCSVIKIRRLTPTLREKLKSPLGLLIRGTPDKTMEKLGELVEREKPSKIISVGDIVSESMVKHGISPQVMIVDNKVMRKPIAPIFLEADQTLHLKNPPGTLTDQAWSIMQEALRQVQRTKVVVDGEEDLLTLVAVLCAPENSLVVYGQPHEGIVVVRVKEQTKGMIRRIVEAMEAFTKS